MRQKVILKVSRVRQHKNECAVAACSSLANFYNPDYHYKDIRKLVPKSVSKYGMSTVEQGFLLNQLGFTCVSIVTADPDFDFSWQKRKLPWKIERLKKLKTYFGRAMRNQYDIDHVESYINFLTSEGCQNNLIIDWDFPRWIKSSLRKGRPVIASINHTAYHKMPKERDDIFDDIKGEQVEHALVIRGFDTNFIYVVDSLGKRTKTHTGYYKIKWQHFLINIGTGDLILV